MTNLHARTMLSRTQAQLNRPYRFNPAPQSQATGNQIFPARTWKFSSQPSATLTRTAISPVMHPAVPVMPISNVVAAMGVAPIEARGRPVAHAAKTPSLGSRVANWFSHLGR